jgi:hypothetical protein
MSFALPKPAVAALPALAFLLATGTQAHAQRRLPSRAYYGSYGGQYRAGLYRNYVLPYAGRQMQFNQATRNVARMGRAVSHWPSYAAGYNAYPAPYPGGYATVAPAGDYYALEGNTYGGYLNGLANVTAAQGQYQKDIQQARITREQSRQMSIDTNMKRIRAEIDYKKMLPTALTVRNRQLKTDLDWARVEAPNNDIWSGKALNTLRNSVIRSGRMASGPRIYVEQDILKGLNLRDVSSSGSVGLVKDSAKLKWPLPLQEPMFDDARNRMNKNMAQAVAQVSAGESVEFKTCKQLKADLDTLNTILNAAVNDMSTSDWIKGRAYLNQLKSTVQGLTQAEVGKSLERSWMSEVRTVGDLLGYMARKGLDFGPAAASSDYAAYKTFYYALRDFERVLYGLPPIPALYSNPRDNQ